MKLIDKRTLKNNETLKRVLNPSPYVKSEKHVDFRDLKPIRK